jgi:hypothetical protein
VLILIVLDFNYICSMFALISLHIFLYGCNLFMWKSTRINCNFIFDFSPSTALTHRDAFLMSASIMCTVVAALVINLFLRNAGATYANALPGALLLVRNQHEPALATNRLVLLIFCICFSCQQEFCSAPSIFATALRATASCV